MVISAPTEQKGRLRPPNPATAPFSVARAVSAGSRAADLSSWNPDPIIRKIIGVRNHVGITAEQIATLGDLLNDLSEKRLDYERQHATVTPHEGGEVLIRIAPYPEKGENLRAEFVAALTDRLGASLATRIATSFGGELAAENNFFGSKTQEIVVTASSGGLYNIRHRYYSPEDPTLFDLTRGSLLGPNDFGDYAIYQSSFPKP